MRTWPMLVGLLLAQRVAAQSACPDIEGTYRKDGTQLSGRDLGRKSGPSLVLDVLRKHKPGARIESITLKVESNNQLAATFLDDQHNSLLAETWPVRCTDGWLIFSRTMTGGSESYRGTVVEVVRLKAGPAGALLANVATDSYGTDFFVVPHSESNERSSEFQRWEGK